MVMGDIVSEDAGSVDFVSDDNVLTIDPILSDPIEFVDTVLVDPVLVDAVGSDVSPDAQTFGGPIDGGTVDGGNVDGGIDGDIGIFVIDTPVEGDPLPVDDSVVTKDDIDPVIYALGDFGTDADAGTGTGTDTTDAGADTGTDPATGSTEEAPGRPIDPQPEWRTLTSNESPGDQATGAPTEDGSTTGTDGDVPPEWAYTDFVPVYDKDPATDGTDTGTDTTDGTPPDVYTMGAGDPLIYASGAGPDPLPPIDPKFLLPVTEEAEIDRTPVHYAPADSFNTGLDLL